MRIENNFKFTRSKSQNNIAKTAKTKNKEFNSNITTSVYNNSNLAGANYYSPSFGLNNPKLALLRAENIKQKFAKYKIDYLLPNETWSNKRIFKTVDKFGKKLDEMFEKKTLSAENINSTMKKLLPEKIAEKIEFRDTKGLKEFLMSKYKFTEKDAIEYMRKVAGLTCEDNGNSIIFLNYKITGDKFKDAYTKLTCMHELKHALTKKCTNINKSDSYNKDWKYFSSENIVSAKNFINELRKYNDVFSGLYFKYKIQNGKLRSLNLTQEDFLKSIKNMSTGQQGFESLEAFHNDIEKEYNAIVKNIKTTTTESLPNDAFNNKEFWSDLKHGMTDEKQAYMTDKVLRSLTDNKKRPTNYEYRSMLYAELAKFCDRHFKAVQK